MYLLRKLPIRIQAKIEIDPDTGCWLWRGEINRNGYGRCYMFGIRRMTHKLTYLLLKAAIPEQHFLDHIYANRYCSRACCNPTHLSPVTPKQNTHRGKAILYGTKNN